jgi:hypothetical protein
MAILTVGGEADCWNLGFGDYVVSATGGRFDADASRNALVASLGVSEYSIRYAESTEIWIHAFLYQESVAAEDLIYIGGDDGAYKIALESDGRWSVYANVAATYTLLATTDDPVLVDEGAHIDIRILMDVSGEIQIYKDEVEVLTFSGDTTGDATYMDNLYIQGLTGAGNETMISQLIIADQPTLGMRLVTLPVTGAGSTSEWTGTAADIDEAELNEADFISALEGDLVSTFALTNVPTPAYDNYAAIAVAVGVLANNPAETFVGNIQAALRIGGINYFSADSPFLTHDGQTVATVFTFNSDPSNASAWNKTKVNALEVGVKSIGL